MDRRIIGAEARSPLRRARRLVRRLLSLVLVSVIGLGIANSGNDMAPEDDGDQDERVAFRHFV